VFYVGKGFARRAWWFKQGRNPYHRSIIEKHGAENIIVTTHPCVSEEAAFELEKVLIAKYRALGARLANQTDGGEGASGRPVSEKVRTAFDANRALPKTTAQRKASSKNLKALWETNPAMRENADAMAEKRRGIKRPAHVVAALVAAHKGKKQSGKRLEQTRASQQIAQEAAKAWHSSEEGKKWHEQHGKSTWANRDWKPCICKECGRTFASPYPTRAKYCEPNCRNTAHRRAAGKPVGVRSKHSAPTVLSGKRAVGQQ
jgi:hypothetical protein